MLWSVTIPETYWDMQVSEDGLTIALSTWPKHRDGYYEDDYLEAHDLSTRVYDRQGNLISMIPGGLALMSGDGNRLYIHGILLPPEEGCDPRRQDCNIYKHGLFDKIGMELWSHTINLVGFEWPYHTYTFPISFTGNTIARECGIYKMKDSELGPGWQPVVPCETIVFDGDTGHILSRIDGVVGLLAVSRDGVYISTGDSAPYEQIGPHSPKEVEIWTRDGQKVLEKVFEAFTERVALSPDVTRMAVGTTEHIHWLDMQGNILWSAPIPAELFVGQITISSDNRVLAVQYTRKTLCPEPLSHTAIVDAQRGQILHTFPEQAVITADGTKALVVVPDRTGYVELWDISPLFQ